VWPGVPATVDAIFCANLLHIAPWPCCAPADAGRGAPPVGGPGCCITYGPYLEDEVPTAAGNRGLRRRSAGTLPQWGLRRREDVAQVAAQAGLRLRERCPCPPTTCCWSGPAAPPHELKYLQGYAPQLLAQVQALIDAGRLARDRGAAAPERHAVRTERALYDYVNELKARHLKSAPPLSKVAYDPKIHVLKNALGTHSAVSRVQGKQLKAKREIRMAALFKDAPADFLRMIVVHELAHLKEREHDKAFYALCEHMEPDYHQLEFDLRLWLTAQELPQGGPQVPPTFTGAT
jgi:predicted metal-dependent hydrolase